MQETLSETDPTVTDEEAAPAQTDGPEAEAGEAAPQDGDETEDGDALEDVEHEGRTYQVPRALKGALMMHADYTRKTQELAQARRAVEAERAQEAQLLEARAGLAAIEAKIAANQRVDLETLDRDNPQAAAELRARLQDLTAARERISQDLAGWTHGRALHEQQVRAARLQEAQAELTRDIAGWSPELAGRLASFAVTEFGVSPQELDEVQDPRLIRLLHAAYVGANAAGANRQAQRHVDAQASRPAATVGGRAAAGKDPSRMTTEEWMRHRNKQLRAQR